MPTRGCLLQIFSYAAVAHSHPNGEEIIYIVRGSGKVMIEGVVEPATQASPVLFPPGESAHVSE